MSHGQRWQVFVFIPNRAGTEQELNKAQRTPRIHAHRSEKQTLCGKKSLLNYSWLLMSMFHQVLPSHYHVKWSVTNDLGPQNTLLGGETMTKKRQKQKKTKNKKTTQKQEH